LLKCACILNDPCADALMTTVRDMRDSDKQNSWWTGLGNWLKEFFGSLGALSIVVLVIIGIIALFSAVVAGLKILIVLLIALLIALILKILWWILTGLLPAIWDGVKNVCGATFSGWHWTGSAPVTPDAGNVARATASVVNPSNASGAPDGRTVSLIACQSVILAMPKPVADERKLWPPGGLDDLKVTATGGPYEVEVANSSLGPWEKCDPVTASNTATFDVPWWGSPWNYVRVHALGPMQLDAVEDIDY
ncbi:MAG TPA: hypothetical protein VN625_06410, partial [Desulfuromonadaceae bacterium]|nr:hypothetical protein [Desulfuromonadaceae bacterium]